MKKWVFALLVVPFVFGCSPSIKRVETNLVKDVGGGWNDTDAQMVAAEMINDCLNAGWYNKTLLKLGKEPVVIVGTVSNNSMEHINTDVFVEEIQRALINSGKVEFVASKSERGEVRTERLEQDEFASEETRKAFGKEIGADFMLSGTLNSVVDKSGKKALVFYQVNMKLINLETNQIVWNGQKQIKKYVKRSKVAW
ncbi:penicillin-binding protein activator LpoB [Candidatus Avelusimicrobium faecicola]|uniref:penicillin-binding protein activator LpoB n=1 Tax=Candidatus Avelusimicrobium faecicola TaxID=3416205 RepID=UPI0015A31DA6|nr:penicillin-binding protein activator LpoB [Spirochaetota bacterium]MCI7536542.1 penicillin-binding protein activator LpoB [Spirochaetota bacterium]MDE3277938.1 penicillin-binding protein activator LpoB [Spirochaetota bacterium]MDY2940328.1 penicillin-binding protein activator LpoB [Elusimicrobiaceae bacterium]MDY6129570.1 penicillin-binding protein activator LpoB [Elusimicrobiaceae bacterium]